MQLRLVLAVLAGLSVMPAATLAGEFDRLKSCVANGNEACLKAVGIGFVNRIKDPDLKARLLTRFGLIDYQSGRLVSGNALLLRAYTIAQGVPNTGCANRTETIFAMEDLTREAGYDEASRLLLRSLIADARKWPLDEKRDCRRSAETPHWLETVALRQSDLGDATGLGQTLDLAFAWGLDPKALKSDFAAEPAKAASLLKRGGREADAIKVCDAEKARLLAALPAQKLAAEEADAHWKALGCYRGAGLVQAAQSAYAQYAALRLSALGLGATEADGPADQNVMIVELLWDMMKDLNWNDPMLAPVAGDFQVKTPRGCFEKPTARCLTIHSMSFVEQQKRQARRLMSGTAPPDFRKAGTLDGFARFLVGADADPVGEQARVWFLEQTEDAPLEDLQSIVGDAIRTGDLVWARRIFYSWYSYGGEQFFRHLTDKDSAKYDDAIEAPDGIDEDVASAWPLHVAWSIALVVAELDPAFEPEELSEFAATAWDDGIRQLPALNSLPRMELIDADERSGTHLLNLCFRNAFGQWAADLFTKAYEPERAAEARLILPEAARDCAFARRSIAPMLQTASWFQEKGDRAATRDLLIEAAERLTRPHYHVYEDSDPYVGGAALAAIALGEKRGLAVAAPYDNAF